MSKAGCDYSKQNTTTTIKDIEQNMPLCLQKSIPTSTQSDFYGLKNIF